MGRLINADDIDYLGADGSLTGYNLFAYCGNNPVMGIDPSGESGVAVLSWWSSVMWAPAVAEPTPIGEIIYGAGCLILGLVAIVEICIIADSVDNTINAASKDENDNDPYLRPNQKKQGRERKEKKNGGKDWKPNPNKK